MVRNKTVVRNSNNVIASRDKIAAKQSPEKLKGLRRRIGYKNHNAPRNDTIIKICEYLFVIAIIFFLSSCSSSISQIPRSQTVTSPVKKTAPKVIVVKQFLPDGWADITSKSKRSEIKYWLMNHDYSATMVLRELQTDSVSQQSLMKEEELTVAANISLISKIPENDPDYRVTRVPEVVDSTRKFVSYVYSEKGLLRRVIVFRKQGTLFEVELFQEHSSAGFDILTNDLITFATTVYER